MSFIELENKEIKFLYKFLPGCIPKSFGINVAK